jgi:hypothetical protein
MPSTEGGNVVSAGPAVSGAAEASGDEDGSAWLVVPDCVVGLLVGTVWQPASSRVMTMMEKNVRMSLYKKWARHFIEVMVSSSFLACQKKTPPKVMPVS